MGGGAGSEIAIVFALALSTVAPVSRQARAAFLEVLGQDYVRTARAKGLGVIAVWTRHVARSALGGIVALASVHAPLVLAATLVVEEVLHVDGLGPGAMEAIRAHDLPWLMGLSLAVATLTLICLVVGDVVQATVDPRARAALAGRRGDG
jgi:peptide/nickel transport system permease protein